MIPSSMKYAATLPALGMRLVARRCMSSSRSSSFSMKPATALAAVVGTPSPAHTMASQAWKVPSVLTCSYSTSRLSCASPTSPTAAGPDLAPIVTKLRALNLGSGLDAEGKLSWVRSVFQALQPGPDGRVSVDCLDRLPSHLVDCVDDVKVLFDRNDNGYIELLEFVYGMNFILQMASKTPHTRAYYDNFMFAMMDEDSNGTVSRQELRSWLRAAKLLGLVRQSYAVDEEGNELPNDALADKMLADCGCTKKGDEITPDEFKDLSAKILDYSVFELYTEVDRE